MYRHWRDDFYPATLPMPRWLEYYAERFDTVELNNPFYRLPDGATFETWGERVPGGFRYAVKAHRYISHVKRLRDLEANKRFWSHVTRLGRRLGPVLYQLPPRWRPDHARLAEFLEAVPTAPQAIEFRDRRWYTDRTFDLLANAGVALCLHDMAGSATPPGPVGAFVYLRFHGAGARYGGRYSSQRLSAWADRIADWSGRGLPVWAYFNNDVGGHAPRDADRLREMVRRRQ